MKFPKLFKLIWWIILLFIISIILYHRKAALLNGTSSTLDIFLFLIFVALMLVPIFPELEFFGLKFRQEIEDLKTEIKIRFGDLRNEIKNNQVQTVHNTFQGIGPPPPDEKLPEIENEIDKILKAKLTEYGVTPTIKTNQLNVPDDNLQMFKVRYNIETEIRRIWETRFSGGDLFQRQAHRSILGMINELIKYQILNNNFDGILREILAICNYAIHGEQLSENQIHFIENNAIGVIDYLRRVK